MDRGRLIPPFSGSDSGPSRALSAPSGSTSPGLSQAYLKSSSTPFITLDAQGPLARIAVFALCCVVCFNRPVACLLAINPNLPLNLSRPIVPPRSTQQLVEHHQAENMSTGPTVSASDTHAPAFPSQSLGHSRGRGHGHSRSSRSHTPISHTVTASDVSQQPLTGIGIVNGHIPDANGHGHHHNHSHSHSHAHSHSHGHSHSHSHSHSIHDGHGSHAHGNSLGGYGVKPVANVTGIFEEATIAAESQEPKR